MKGDFSRNTFDQYHRYSRVLMQQGRVLLDADWNEQTSILLHYLRALAADLIGPHGGPGQGFEIQVNEDLKCDFVIGRGHYYVDGILCENLPPAYCPPRPDEPPPLTYNNQADYPLTEELELKAGTEYVVFLDVWERHLTHFHAPHIREVALGGSDTATRARIVCQVKAVELDKDPPSEADCAALLAELVQRGHACLRARARVETPSDDPCIIPPNARYRGLENQLYRVEIHTSGEAGAAKEGATFKWSRDNGSVVFPIRSLAGSIVTLDSLGPDESRGIKEGDWVEIVNDDSVLRAEPGILAEVIAVDRVTFEVTLDVPDGTLPAVDREITLLRRWDQGSDVIAVQEAKWIDLEDGVQIYFEPGGSYNTGDFWLIPARTATGDVLWPSEENEQGLSLPKALPPGGIEHHYAPLALISLDNYGFVTREEDCRCTFEPLCAAEAALGAGTDARSIILAELTRIDDVGRSRAETILDSGRTTPKAVAEMTVPEIVGLLRVNESRAMKIKKSAGDVAAGRV